MPKLDRRSNAGAGMSKEPTGTAFQLQIPPSFVSNEENDGQKFAHHASCTNAPTLQPAPPPNPISLQLCENGKL